MSNVAPEMTVGQLVAERPARSRVFEQLGIDFCCGGKIPLKDASLKKGLAVEQVIEALASSDTEPNSSSPHDVAQLSMSELCDHIEQTHHRHLKTELPRLRAMVQKVAAVHGENHQWLREIESVYCSMADELEAHMAKEEQILFPLIRSIDQSAAQGKSLSSPMNVAMPIRVMEHEHDDAGAALQRMRELSHNYQVPPNACNTFLAMLDGLRELELDMHQHVHKENNVLFPRAEAAETH